MDSFKARSLEDLEKALERETMPLFAAGDTDYTNACEQWLDYYKRQRRQPSQIISQPRYSRSGPWISEESQRALDALAAIGYTGLRVDDLSRLAPCDEFKDELIVMAEVRGYFDVAHRVSRIVTFPSI